MTLLEPKDWPTLPPTRRSFGLVKLIRCAQCLHRHCGYPGPTALKQSTAMLEDAFKALWAESPLSQDEAVYLFDAGLRLGWLKGDKSLLLDHEKEALFDIHLDGEQHGN